MGEAGAPLQEVEPSRYSVVAQLQLRHKFLNDAMHTHKFALAFLSNFYNKIWAINERPIIFAELTQE